MDTPVEVSAPPRLEDSFQTPSTRGRLNTIFAADGKAQFCVRVANRRCPGGPGRIQAPEANHNSHRAAPPAWNCRGRRSPVERQQTDRPSLPSERSTKALPVVTVRYSEPGECHRESGPLAVGRKQSPFGQAHIRRILSLQKARQLTPPTIRGCARQRAFTLC